MTLNIKALGMSLGITWALAIFIIGLVAMGGYGAGFVEAIAKLYLGYDSTFIGSIIGAIWAFIDGFVGGAVIAWIYNKFV